MDLRAGHWISDGAGDVCEMADGGKGGELALWMNGVGWCGFAGGYWKFSV